MALQSENRLSSAPPSPCRLFFLPRAWIGGVLEITGRDANGRLVWDGHDSQHLAKTTTSRSSGLSPNIVCVCWSSVDRDTGSIILLVCLKGVSCQCGSTRKNGHWDIVCMSDNQPRMKFEVLCENIVLAFTWFCIGYNWITTESLP